MENKLKLYMVMLGCVPKGRLTEQHDIFFGIGTSLKELVSKMKAFWPEAKGKIHIDAWREVTVVDNFSIVITEKNTNEDAPTNHLFFINLGGYKENDFEEYHYKLLSVAETLGKATKKSKATAFYKHCGFAGAISHIDDKYGIDIDNVVKVADVLDVESKNKYSLLITPIESALAEDVLHIGYVKIKSLS